MIGSKIKAARNAKGYTQDYVAALLEVTQASYSRIESDVVSPDIFKLKMLSTILDLDIKSLLAAMHTKAKKIQPS